MPARDFPRWSRKKKRYLINVYIHAGAHGLLIHVINAFLTRLVRSIWLDVGLFLFCVFSATSTSFRSATYKNVACVACVQRGGERRGKGRGDWGEKERDSLPFPLGTFLRPPLPFHFLCLRT